MIVVVRQAGRVDEAPIRSFFETQKAREPRGPQNLQMVNECSLWNVLRCGEREAARAAECGRRFFATFVVCLCSVCLCVGVGGCGCACVL